jgi:hypothetical protein
LSRFLRELRRALRRQASFGLRPHARPFHNLFWKITIRTNGFFD